MSFDVVGKINYLTSTTDGAEPWLIENSIPATQRSNFVQAPVPVTITDLRGQEESFSLDVQGFEVLKYDGSVQGVFEQDSEAQTIYYNEIGELLKKRLGASRVLIYHHTFRFRTSALPDDKLDYTHRNPIFYPHVDAVPTGAHKFVDDKLGKEEAERVKKHRFQLMNIWRPVGPNPITDTPLTICDFRSVDMAKEPYPFTIRGVNRDFTSYALTQKADSAHLWYYMSRMRSDEMFVFKIYDTKTDVAACAFHTAFHNGDGPKSKEEQTSLELRCLVLYDE